MDRILIRKLIWNIFSEAQYINTMMELADRKNPDSAIALSQDELREILIMLSQADYLKDYLKENGILARANHEEHKAKVVDHECSNCGFWLTYGIVDYCPGCGARLDWGDVNG